MGKRRLLLYCIVAATTVTIVLILRPRSLAIIHTSGEPTIDKTLPKDAGDVFSSEQYRPERERDATRLFGTDHKGAAGAYVTEQAESVTTPYITSKHEKITTKLYITPEPEGNTTSPTGPHTTPEQKGITTSKDADRATIPPTAYPRKENSSLSTSRLPSPGVSPSSGNPDLLTSTLASATVSPRSGLGYALAFSYSDQLTAAAVNLLSLMCVTSKFGGVRVVEPFIVNSELGLNASKNWTEELTFRDINDMSVWTKYVSAKEFSQFVSFETFIKDAPRKVLLVQYYHSCGDQKMWNKARQFCDSNGFKLVGKVCLEYDEEKLFTVSKLENQIYSHFNKTDVVVLFELYGGIEEQEYSSKRAYRLFGKNTKCDRHTVYDKYSAQHPSPSIFSDANTYIERYLNGSSSYISLMVRLERILRISNGWNGRNASQCSRQCLNNIVKRWRDVKQQTGITTTFLAIDVGRYGSNAFHFHPEIEHSLLPPLKEFFSALFDNKTSLQEWENTFSSVGRGRTRNPGYIAMMQKVIAVKGNVLMLVGTEKKSAFQTTGIRLYHSFHGEGQIIELNNECT